MIFEYFDNIIIRAPSFFEERWQQTKQELDKFNLKYERHSDGIKGETRSEREKTATNEWFNIIQKAKDRNYKNVLILEDDVIIDTRISKYETLVKNFLNNNYWELFYFGCNHEQTPDKTNKNIWKVKRAWCMHSVAVNCNIYDEILKNKIDLKTEGDVMVADKIQSRGNSYALHPRICYQRSGFSNIQNEVVNYDYALKDKEEFYE